MDSGNPFGASVAQPFNSNNQNDPFGNFYGTPQQAGGPAQVAIEQQQLDDPWGVPSNRQQQPNALAYTQNPYAPQAYGAPIQPTQIQQPPYQQQPQSHYQQQQSHLQPSQSSFQHQPQVQYQQQAQNIYGGSTPFGPPASPVRSQGNAVVVSQFQSNPYAPSLTNQDRAVVVSQYQSNPYANLMVDGGGFQHQHQTSNPFSAGVDGQGQSNPFDPFSAPAPAPYAAPPPDPFTSQNPSYEQPFDMNRPQAFSAESEPYLTQTHPHLAQSRGSFDGAFSTPAIQENEEYNNREQQQQPEMSAKDQPIQSSTAMVEHRAERKQVDAPKPEEIPATFHTPSYDYGQRPNINPDPDPSEKESPRNKYALELARRAPPGASPLPKADLVRKKGFVLSRISFRTIVMKKWKQSYWVQYGPHTMLWFRSQGDFDDWLNNPYHNQAERNFLIKLAVNFVHDLYKPNVRGYQVTQCRTKGYGNKLVRQFKLERWMDYGPTIAAAFGSYNPKEVDDLREAIVDCMRNTPLNGGIRATGAVRQRPQENAQHRQRSDSQGSSSRDSAANAPPSPDAKHQGGGYRRESYDNLPSEREEKEESVNEKPAEEVDLMDVKNWDDPTQPQTMQPDLSGGYGAAGYGQQPPPYQGQQQYQSQGQQPFLNQQQYPPPQQQPQAAYPTALVPSNQPQVYPGASQLLQQQQYQFQQQQAQSYPGAPNMPPQQQFVAQATGGLNQTIPQQQQAWGQPAPGQQQHQQNPWMTNQQPQVQF